MERIAYSVEILDIELILVVYLGNGGDLKQKIIFMARLICLTFGFFIRTITWSFSLQGIFGGGCDKWSFSQYKYGRVLNMQNVS